MSKNQLFSNQSLMSTREQLMAMLAEAAEVEHNLMCCYLYAAFSIKTDASEGISDRQLKSLKQWRQSIISISIEEMSHLALVANLSCSIGGVAHFGRDNFPISPGLLPADISVKLAPFDMDTLDHFIYLERPETSNVSDGDRFIDDYNYQRGPLEQSKLTPVSQDYETVGELYQSILDTFQMLESKLGADGLFINHINQQVGPNITPLPGLQTISNMSDVKQAIGTIVTQGEGAPEDCGEGHYARFLKIKEEYLAYLDEDPSFKPGRPVAVNPVMRRPVDDRDRVWITEPAAASVMDYVNALYIQMLRLLSQGFGHCGSEFEQRTLIETATDLMYAMTPAAENLTLLKANQTDECNAGISFALTRSIAAVPYHGEWLLLESRFKEIVEVGQNLKSIGPGIAEAVTMVSNIAKTFSDRVKTILYERKLTTNNNIDDHDKQNSSDKSCPSIRPLKNGPLRVEVLSKITIDGGNFKLVGTTFLCRCGQSNNKPYCDRSHLKINFSDSRDYNLNDKRLVFSGKPLTIYENIAICAHAGRCPKGKPDQWRGGQNANKYSDKELMQRIESCPSGALSYSIDGDEFKHQSRTKKLTINKNLPIAVEGGIKLQGVDWGEGASKEHYTLCRCGASKMKPFCDGSHENLKMS